MTTTTEALMALADAAINAESEATADAISGPTADAALSAEKAKAARAELASELTRFAALVAEHCAKTVEGSHSREQAAQAIREQFKEQP